jgi:hypothetical protein
LVGALFLGVLAQAEEPATQPLPIETVKGECSHPDEKVTRWVRMIDDTGTASYRCEAATLDWGNRITFFSDGDGMEGGIAFLGRRGPDGEFAVTAIDDHLLGESPASGRCRLFTPEDAGARRVLCYAKESENKDRTHLVEMVIAEKEWPGAADISGRCSTPGIARYVLSPLIVRQTGEQREPVLEPQVLPPCDVLTVVTGQSFAFSAKTGTLIFLGAADDARPSRLVVTRVILPDGVQHETLAGVCVPMRQSDGEVVALCMAAYEQDGVRKYVEVGFIPEGSRFTWPENDLVEVTEHQE